MYRWGGGWMVGGIAHELHLSTFRRGEASILRGYEIGEGEGWWKSGRKSRENAISRQLSLEQPLFEPVFDESGLEYSTRIFREVRFYRPRARLSKANYRFLRGILLEWICSILSLSFSLSSIFLRLRIRRTYEEKIFDRILGKVSFERDVNVCRRECDIST